MPDRLAGEDEDNDSARKDFLILMEVECLTRKLVRMGATILHIRIFLYGWTGRRVIRPFLKISILISIRPFLKILISKLIFKDILANIDIDITLIGCS